jgi:hypothetical protein
MLGDLAALTPPLVVCAAFLIGVVLFLRRQMGAGTRPADPDSESDIQEVHRNVDAGDPEAVSSQDHG